MDEWKQKYFDSLEELEQKEKLWKQVESSLKRSISRLSFIGDGRDADLDQRLEELRNRVRGEQDMRRLQEMIDRVTAVAERVQAEAFDEQQVRDALIQLLEVTTLPASVKSDRHRLLRQLRREPLSQQLLEQFSSLIKHAFAAAGDTAAEQQGGLLGRLFGGDKRASTVPEAQATAVEPSVETDADRPQPVTAEDILHYLLQRLPDELHDVADILRRRTSGAQQRQEFERLADELFNLLQPQASELPSAEQVLMGLLEQIELPTGSEPAVEALKSRLQHQLKDADLPQVLEQLAALIGEAQRDAEQDRLEVERFLLQLTDQLGQLDLELLGIGTQGEEILQQSQSFGSSVAAQMSGLHESVESATDLGDLKQLISVRILDVQDRLRQHREAELARERDFRQSIDGLQQRLQEMEQHSEDLQRKVDEARIEAFTDALTGLNNRHALDHRMEEEYQRWLRYQFPMSLMVLDIDHFKRVNDSYGHAAGDKVLQVIGRLLKQCTRDSDFAARFGGEEFVTLLPETDIDGARVAAEKIRASLAAKAFHSGDDRVIISASFGIAQFQPGETAEVVFERADAALYLAKSSGRNCCMTELDLATAERMPPQPPA